MLKFFRLDKSVELLSSIGKKKLRLSSAAPPPCPSVSVVAQLNLV